MFSWPAAIVSFTLICKDLHTYHRYIHTLSNNVCTELNTEWHSVAFNVLLSQQISSQSAFLQSVSCSKTLEGMHMAMYFMDLIEINLAEVSTHTCIMGTSTEYVCPIVCVVSNHLCFLTLCSQHGISDYLQIVRSRYQPPPTSPKFDLPALQQDILEAYVAGKPTMMNPSSIRTIFKFKEKCPTTRRPTE